MLLGVLIGAEREDVQALGPGDVDDAGHGLVDGGPAEMMPQQRIGAFQRMRSTSVCGGGVPATAWACSPRRKATTAGLDVPLANVI